MDFFFYGTLMDRDVLKTVIGRSLPPAYSTSAVLIGYRRVYKSGATYPILLTSPKHRIEGMLVSALGERDVTRLDAFEGLNYKRERLQVVLCSGQEERSAWVYLPRANVRGTNKEWHLHGWTRRHKRKYINRINTVGSYPKSFS